jgi:beta-glucanase (GH16 family)
VRLASPPYRPTTAPPRRRLRQLGPVGLAVVMVVGLTAGGAWWALRDRASGPLFEEDFDGNTLDTETWSTCYYWRESDCTNEWNDELQVYTDDNVEISGGSLVLTARQQDAEGFTMSDEREGFDFTSGMVTTESSFAFTYGYVEVRARVPSADGVWPAIWLLPINREWPPEIDIMEHVGDPGVYYSTVHPGDGTASSSLACRTTPEQTEGWHTFAADWQPGRVTFYLDGVECGTVDQGVPDVEMYLLLNVALGGEWAGPPRGGEDLPARMEVDWIRVSGQRPEPEAVPAPDGD